MLGRLPLATRLAQQVLPQVRPWIEPAQSFEKNQLGLGFIPNASDLMAGQTYQLNLANNLNNWTNFGSPFVATNTI